MFTLVSFSAVCFDSSHVFNSCEILHLLIYCFSFHASDSSDFKILSLYHCSVIRHLLLELGKTVLLDLVMITIPIA